VAPGTGRATCSWSAAERSSFLAPAPLPDAVDQQSALYRADGSSRVAGGPGRGTGPRTVARAPASGLRLPGYASPGGRSRACRAVQSRWPSRERNRSSRACWGRSPAGHATQITVKDPGARAGDDAPAVAGAVGHPDGNGGPPRPLTRQRCVRSRHRPGRQRQVAGLLGGGEAGLAPPFPARGVRLDRGSCAASPGLVWRALDGHPEQCRIPKSARRAYQCRMVAGHA
jgi:hypothetical protein